MINAVLKFFAGDPVVSSWLTFAVCMLIAAATVAINSARERRHRRTMADRDARCQRVAAAANLPREWSAPAAKGFDRNRKTS